MSNEPSWVAERRLAREASDRLRQHDQRELEAYNVRWGKARALERRILALRAQKSTAAADCLAAGVGARPSPTGEQVTGKLKAGAAEANAVLADALTRSKAALARRGQQDGPPLPGTSTTNLSAAARPLLSTITTPASESKRRASMSSASAALAELEQPTIKEIRVHDGSVAAQLARDEGGMRQATSPRDPFTVAACASRLADVEQALADSESALFAALAAAQAGDRDAERRRRELALAASMHGEAVPANVLQPLANLLEQARVYLNASPWTANQRRFFLHRVEDLVAALFNAVRQAKSMIDPRAFVQERAAHFAQELDDLKREAAHVPEPRLTVPVVG
jgi:hypothetical protein